MCYAQVPVPHDEHSHYVLQTHPIKRKKERNYPTQGRTGLRNPGLDTYLGIMLKMVLIQQQWAQDLYFKSTLRLRCR